MAKNNSPIKIPEQYLSPIEINGLRGRKLVVPAKKKKHQDREILFFVGSHATLERMYYMTTYLSNFGEVVAYDYPGLGGMDSFYKIGKKPTLDNYAEYFYAIFKTHKYKKRTTVLPISLSSVFVTRMLQLYPDVGENIDEVVTFVGFGDHEDMRMSKRNKWLGTQLSRFLTTMPGQFLAKLFVFNPIGLRVMMGFFLRYNPKLKNVSRKVRKMAVQMELDLWRRNDLRTHFAMYVLILTLKLEHDSKIKIPLYDISTDSDQYFESDKVTATLKRLYEDVTITRSKLEVHVPGIIDNEDVIDPIIPDEIKEALLRDL